jgi:F-type H+-transporting ATPase subunit gamma
MSQRRQLEQRLAGQGEIGEILTSMKNLAYMETRKLARLLDNQRRVVEQIERIAREFLTFHPGLLPPLDTTRRVYLVIGSRRGLCGDFNARLVAALRAELAEQGGTDCLIIAVGHKLCQRLADLPLDLVELEGGDVAEEIPQVLQALVKELDRQQSQQVMRSLIVLYHADPLQAPLRRQLLPPFTQSIEGPPVAGFPPLLNLEPRQFLLGLIDQYLYAMLHAALYQSLDAENERRIRHLDGAVRHLDERAAGLQRRIHALRQEEIIEEIEVILLNAVGLDEPSPMGP